MTLVFAALLAAWLGFLTPAAAQTDAGAAQGRMVFFTQGCYGCHRLGVAGTPIAYDLSHIGRKYSAAQLAQWLRDPSQQKPSAHMPRLALTEEEIQALAAFLSAQR